MRNNKGITMITLIVTIIILLILAGVTIAFLTGENGILNKASTAAETTKKANAKERLKVELMAIQTEELADGKEANLSSLDTNKEQLSKKGIEIAESGTPRDVTLDGYTFKVKNDLTIEGDGTATGGTGSSGSGGQTGESTGTTLEQINFYGGTINSSFAGGDGSENNPYLIDTAVQLVFFATTVNDGYNTYEGKYIKLNKDITLDSSKQWTPIGNSTTNFKGIFDGNGKTISGIYINGDEKEQALFGCLGTNGIIRNLIIEGTIKQGGENIAGICNANYGVIENCINKATITSAGNYYQTGGICCINYGMIQNCANLASISAYDGVGGIAGWNLGIIRNCYNKGAIYGAGWTTGGIVGHCGFGSNTVGYIYNCYNNANVTSGHSGYVAGIAGGVGYDNSKAYIYNCYTIKNTTIYGNNYSNPILSNNYTTEANTKLTELNSGIDDVDGTDTEQPWIEDTENINGGYPILKWQQ